MRIAVMGAGAMGCFFGGMLARAGEDVTFIARGRQFAALNDVGLSLRSAIIGDWTQRVQATDDPGSVGAVDVVLFCVKTYDLDAARHALVPLLGPETSVLTIQNGVESAERVGEIVGNGRVLCGVSWVTANVESPGVVSHARGTRLIFGEATGGTSTRVQQLHETLARGGIAAEVHPSVHVPLWQKFMAMCPAGGLSAVTRLPMGPLVGTPETASLARGLIEEVEAVGRARGIELPADCGATTYDALLDIAAETPWAYPSLYHDLAAGRRLELDALNGAVQRLGAACAVPTPLNFAINAALAAYKKGAPVVPARPSTT